MLLGGMYQYNAHVLQSTSETRSVAGGRKGRAGADREETGKQKQM